VIDSGELDERLLNALRQDSPDHRILNAAMTLQQREPGRAVILVSKDTNLRIKARSLGVPAEDYTSDKVESFDKLYTGKRTVNEPAGRVDRAFYGNAEGVPKSSLFPEIADPAGQRELHPAQRQRSRRWPRTARGPESFVRVEKLSAYGIAPRNAEQSFAWRP
jgi:PhoH-like ATPase